MYVSYYASQIRQADRRGGILFSRDLFNVLCGGGYAHFSLQRLIPVLLPIYDLSPANFTSCYLMFFLFIPFINILLKQLSRGQHAVLILLNVFAYSILGSIPGNHVPINYLSWFAVIYLVGAYIRLYPGIPLFTNHLKTKLFLCLFFSGLSVVVCDWVNVHLGKHIFWLAYFGVADSNKLLALLTAVFAFCYFKRLKISYSPFINGIAASAFGVLLIHSNCREMMNWLWKTTLRNADFYSSDFIFIHSVCSVLLIYVICTLIDRIRLQFVEKPFMNIYDRHRKMLEAKVNNLTECMLKML